MTKVVEFTGERTGNTSFKIPHQPILEVGDSAIVEDELAADLLQKFDGVSDWKELKGDAAKDVKKKAADAEAEAAEEAAKIEEAEYKTPLLDAQPVYGEAASSAEG